MPQYTIEFASAADRQLRKLPRHAQERLKPAIDALRLDPRPVGMVKLTGEWNQWRIRVGDYRVVYEIHDGRLLVLVVRVEHRRGVYRRK